MKLKFSKYHGAGNDFIMVDNRDGTFTPETSLIAALCDRRLGIGADGLILLNKMNGYDFGMKYYNSDGKESTMCGNGGRCITAFADSLSHSGEHYRFLAVDGEHESTVLIRERDTYLVRLGMNDVKSISERNGDYVLNTGSPHYVKFVDDVLKIHIIPDARSVRYNQEYSLEGINVNFVQELMDSILVRTYERGVEDETLSCGTGVTASALSFAYRKNLDKGLIHVTTRGGNLDVHFTKSKEGFTGIYLEGPAKMVYSGDIDLDELVKFHKDYLIKR